MTYAEISTIKPESLKYTIDDFCLGSDNAGFPVMSNSLKVLAIGNSFTDDGTAYLQELVTASGIDQSQLCVYFKSYGGASINKWLELTAANYQFGITRRAGKYNMPITVGTLQSVLAQDWDVVVIQQVSDSASIWSSFENLDEYLKIIRTNCSNPNLCIAYQLPWSRNPNMQSQYLKNVECYRRASFKNGIDYIIPTGTSIQNARNTSLNDEYGILRDDRHLSYGLGRYIAACTWFEKLISPAYGVSVLGNKAIHMVSESESENVRSKDVTTPIAKLCQSCAYAAVTNPYKVTTMTNIEENHLSCIEFNGSNR